MVGLLLKYLENPIFVLTMKTYKLYNKFAIALLLTVAVNIAALGTGLTGKNKSSFSLKKVNKAKGFSLTGLKHGSFQLKGSSLINYQRNSDNTVTVNSVIRYQSGNTTYVYPYKFKAKAPLFKTPQAPAIR